ncbi:MULTISPECIES: phage tail protein [unclassified Shinella]|uniref:phage tail protein n=1 Tax=unclassified Shinella TaxID=2643062 RepID=UPI00234E958E|nr:MULTISPECIES: phage tail protein [unclassified Shinella]MCO5153395.1 phage tail protein [Shinella sp.]MDC7260574.1 phage tail protein [Shinella sp. HY16]MDC7267469.1 phage tail protein [Shinella sp. YZ44]
MSGPVAMMLGSFGFEALGFGFDTVQRRLQTPWADIPVAQDFNQQQWTGPTSEEVTIKGVLFPVEFGGQESLDGILAAASAGMPMMLVSGSEAAGVIHGMFTVQGVEEDRSFHTRRGTPMRNAYSISLKRYGGGLSGSSLLTGIVDIFR